MDINLTSGFTNFNTGSSADMLRDRQNKLMEDLDKNVKSKEASSAKSERERKGIIVELSSVSKELELKVYRETEARLENQRLKNNEIMAKTARDRNKARRERERLLMNQCAEKLAAANSKLNEEVRGGFDNSRYIDNDLKEARELSTEARAVASRRQAEEWKEHAEEKARRQKKKHKINVEI